MLREATFHQAAQTTSNKIINNLKHNYQFLIKLLNRNQSFSQMLRNKNYPLDYNGFQFLFKLNQKNRTYTVKNLKTRVNMNLPIKQTKSYNVRKMDNRNYYNDYYLNQREC